MNPNSPDIGYQPARQLSPEYFAAINGQSMGSIIAPFRTQYGFNIVKVTGVKKYSEIDKDLYKAIIFDMMIDLAEKEYNIPIRKNSLPE